MRMRLWPKHKHQTGLGQCAPLPLETEVTAQELTDCTSLTSYFIQLFIYLFICIYLVFSRSNCIASNVRKINKQLIGKILKEAVVA
jgi:hypothetical protein